jgi:putative membrane protein
MKIAVVVVGAAVIAGGGLLAAQAPGQPPASAPQPMSQMSSEMTRDQRFIREAARGGTTEVVLGKLAADRAASQKIKAFGERMVADHGKAVEALKNLAASKQVTLPTALGPKNQAIQDRLAKLTGPQFDRAYVKNMLADHKKDVADFMHEASSGKDPAVRAWAAQVLPTLQEHLRMVRELDKEMSGTKATQ